MKTKSLFIVLAGLMIFFACDNKPKNAYVVEGTVADSTLNGQTIYIAERLTGKIDSTVVADGKFKFEGVVDTAIVAQLGVGRMQKQFVLESGQINLDLTEDGVATGTALNEALNAISKQLMDAQEKVMNELNAAREAGDEDKINELREAFYEEMESIQNTAFKANSNNAVGAYILRNILASATPEEADELYAQAGELVKANPGVARSMKRIEQIKLTSEGSPFIDFTIDYEDGTKASLSDFVGKGKYVLVDFWASWCGPCRAEIPNLKNVYAKYKGDKFEILGVAVWEESVDDSKKAMEELGMTWPQILDAESIPTDLYGISGIPTIILFAPDGTIVSRTLRGEAIGEKLAEVLS